MTGSEPNWLPNVDKSSWPEPTPIGHSIYVPPFPVEVYPGWLADQVTAVAEFTQTDPAMAGGVGLTVLSTCGGGRLVVEVEPGWREPVNIYQATVAAPGERKSPVQAAMTRPLRAAEAGLARSAGPTIAEQRTMRDIAENHVDKLKSAAAKATGDKREELAAEAVAAAQAAEAITVPTVPRLFADDVTPEALASLMADNGGRMSIISDEGGIFDILAGRYSDKANLDTFLKAHAGMPIRIDRKGRAPEYVESPALTVGLMVQPVTMRKVGAHEEFRGRGLVARFFFILPESRVGARLVNPEPVHPDTAATYAAHVTTMARTLAEWEDPAVVALTDEAREIRLKTMQEIEGQLGAGGELESVVEWANKLYGGIPRLAGLLHLAHHPDDAWRLAIDADTMSKAVQLAHVLIAHYRAAVDSMGLDRTVEAARYLLAAIQRKRWQEFTTRELFNAVTRSRFPKVTDLTEPLQLLVDHDWTARQDPPDRDGPGRKPSPGYRVNPALAAEPAKSAEGEATGR